MGYGSQVVLPHTALTAFGMSPCTTLSGHHRTPPRLAGCTVSIGQSVQRLLFEK